MDTIRTNTIDDALAAANRLAAMGVVIKSPELIAESERRQHLAQNGNRALRRARRAQRKRGN